MPRNRCNPLVLHPHASVVLMDSTITLRRIAPWFLASLLACTGQVGDVPLEAPDTAIDIDIDAGTATETPDSDLPPEPVVDLAELFSCDEGQSGSLPPRIVRLSQREYAAVVQGAFANEANPLELEALPFGILNSSDRFTTFSDSYRVGDAEVEGVIAAAATIGRLAAEHLSTNGRSCLTNDDVTLEACVRQMVTFRGARLFRRPLTPSEIDTYVEVALADAGTASERDVASTAFEAMLRAPQFLFRSELGEPTDDGRLQLTAHEVASALSFTLTDGPPDATLREAADSGLLNEPDEVVRQVERLLANPAQVPAARRFVREFFRYDDALHVPKDEELYPDHDAEALVADTDRLAQHLLRENGRSDFYRALLTTDDIFAGEATYSAYGLTEAPSGPVTAPRARLGILLQPSWLVGFSGENYTLPIQRGKFMLNTFLCDRLPDIPVPDIEPLAPEENQTVREALESHVQPACAMCHDLMDPLGLPFEQFDHTGRYRDEELERPVVTTGELNGSGDETDGAVADPVDLVTRLAESSRSRQCFVRHSFEFWFGTLPTPRVACALAQSDEAFAEDGDFVGLLARLFSSDAFRYRQLEETP